MSSKSNIYCGTCRNLVSLTQPSGSDHSDDHISCSLKEFRNKYNDFRQKLQKQDDFKDLFQLLLEKLKVLRQIDLKKDFETLNKNFKYLYIQVSQIEFDFNQFLRENWFDNKVEYVNPFLDSSDSDSQTEEKKVDRQIYKLNQHKVIEIIDSQERNNSQNDVVQNIVNKQEISYNQTSNTKIQEEKDQQQQICSFQNGHGQKNINNNIQREINTKNDASCKDIQVKQMQQEDQKNQNEYQNYEQKGSCQKSIKSIKITYSENKTHDQNVRHNIPINISYQQTHNKQICYNDSIIEIPNSNYNNLQSQQSKDVNGNLPQKSIQKNDTQLQQENQNQFIKNTNLQEQSISPEQDKNDPVIIEQEKQNLQQALNVGDLSDFDLSSEQNFQPVSSTRRIKKIKQRQGNIKIYSSKRRKKTKEN